jgi:hypothetical protein
MPPHGHLVAVRGERCGVVLFLTAPHPGGDGMFFRPDGIGVDGGRGELRMPQPFLDEIEGYTRGDRRDAKAMA